jgi:hypothetical protein
MGKRSVNKCRRVGSGFKKIFKFRTLGKMAEVNTNDINYFKCQTVTNPNTGNKTSLHDIVVENVDGAIYLIEKEGLNVEEDTTFDKNFKHLTVKDNGIGEYEKFVAQLMNKVYTKYLYPLG